MSTIKFELPVYKVYEPGYHPHRTIILDEQIESPETLTIRLEEEAIRSGGDFCGGSPTGLLPMPTYKPEPPQLHGYADSPYTRYSPQSFSAQQSENAASQINQLAFAANNAAAGQYLASQAAPSTPVHVVSCHPNSGSHGTKVSLRVTSEFELLSSTMPASAPSVSILFGSQRCAAQVVKSEHDHGRGETCAYTITAEAPQFLSTTCSSLSKVPLTLLVESANGAEIARATNAGVFSYHPAQSITAGSSVGVGGSGDTSPPGLGSPKTRSPVPRGSPPHQVLPAPASTTSPSTSHGISSDPSTNTYGFPPSLSADAAVVQAQAQAQAQAHAQSDYAADNAGTYNQGNNSMLGAYRNASFTDHYSRAPPILSSPHRTGWTPFGSNIDSVRSPGVTLPHTSHTAITRPSFTPLHHSSLTAPQLVRTSTLAQQPNSGSGGSGNYIPYSLHQAQIKATLNIHGDLVSMAENWTHEEWENKRRLVIFKKQQHGNVLTTTFKPVSVSDRPPNSICISCIWWEEKKECFVTSVDTIHLLEQLVAAPNRFSVEEKNRIRRNLEGFHPLTVSKAKAESEEFFKVIMSFGNPKPRNIEKDVKVFPWKILAQALSKIISKYSASSASIATPNNSSHLLPPGTMGAAYTSMPPTSSPVSTTAGDPAATTGYVSAGQHIDSVTSPTTRPPSGGTSAWASFIGAARTMSPVLKTSPPTSTSGIRISALTALYDSRSSPHNLASPYSMSSASHHGSHHSQRSYSQAGIPVTQSHARNWEGYSAAESYSTTAGHSHGQVYGSGALGEGTQRA